MTQLHIAKVWKDPFSPEEVAKTPPEKGFNTFGTALLEASQKVNHRMNSLLENINKKERK